MTIFDRLYGLLKFPQVISEMLDCPGLLRLREVHMSNIPFVLFPSFSSVNRYEHSLGVCHLAQITSDSLGLSTKDKIELMCACLYHDAATPPFAHVTEAILHEQFGFNHEAQIKNLLTGRTDDPCMEKMQIYKGKGLKLSKIVNSKEGQKIDLDIFRIADMAVGKGELGPLVKGEIDLDNIDNVIRAATAMGTKIAIGSDAEMLSRSFALSINGLQINEAFTPYLQKWQQTRFELYDKIYGDVEDFSLETMLNLAIKILLKSNEDNRILSVDWKLTDDELVTERIMKNADAREIWERILLFRPYPNIGIWSIVGEKTDIFLRKNMNAIEELAFKCYKQVCYANVNADKRKRAITYPLTGEWGYGRNNKPPEKEERTFLFLFSLKKPKNQAECHKSFSSELQSILPSNINLHFVRRINDKYPRLMEETS